MSNLFFSHNVRFLLTLRKMSQERLAEATTLFLNTWGRRNLSRRLDNTVKVSLEDVKDIATALNVPAGDLCFMGTVEFRNKYRRKNDE